MKYESKIHSIQAPIERVYQTLSNLQSMERMRDLIPQDKVQELIITDDAISIKVDGLGQHIRFYITDRIENDTIRFEAEGIPVPLRFWIQLKKVAPEDTRIRLTLDVELPMMLKMMFGSKLQTGLDQAAEILSQLSY